MQAYQIYGTPSGYLIDVDGRIASPLVLGADGLLELCDPASTPAPGSAEANGRGGGSESRAGGGLRTRDTSESRLVRDGLKAGTIAPTFVLPDLDARSSSRRCRTAARRWAASSTSSSDQRRRSFPGGWRGPKL